MNDDLTPIDEQALDALLDESIAGTGPPDLSQAILTQLRGSPGVVDTPLHVAARTEARVRPSSFGKQATAAIAITAAVAASLLAMVWLRNNHQPVVSPVAGADQLDALGPTPGTKGAIESSRIQIADSSPRSYPPEGVPLLVESTQPPTGTDAPPDSPESATILLNPPEAVTLVAAHVDADLRSYWEAMGIEPSGDAEPSDVAVQLNHALGVDVPLDMIDDADGLQVILADARRAADVATRWLTQITEGGLARVDKEARETLIAELAACFESQHSFDQLLTSWIRGRADTAQAFYMAMSSPHPDSTLQSGSRNDALVRRLAALTMNVDLRCIRCHKSYIDGVGRQHDYWTFAALLDQHLTTSLEGLPPQSRETGASLFYERSDGRQRLAEPSIAASWIANQTPPITSMPQWADRLVGSRELARGVVNSLWQLVHGRPLQGRVVDPVSAPHHESLSQLEERLTDDLMRSRFDVTRTLALVIAAPATRREVAPPLRSENILSASKIERQSAIDAAGAFAAALPTRHSLSQQARLDVAMRASGAKLESGQKPVMAQWDTTKPIVGRQNAAASTLPADFPAREDSLPVQWLGLIDDESNRIEHLGYLAGHSGVSRSLHDAAQVMRKSDIDEALVLHRVWWLLQP